MKTYFPDLLRQSSLPPANLCPTVETEERVLFPEGRGDLGRVLVDEREGDKSRPLSPTYKEIPYDNSKKTTSLPKHRFGSYIELTRHFGL